MVILDRSSVRGVEISPTEGRAAPYRYPRMSSVCSRELLFAWRGDGANISAYVKRWQGDATHCSDHDMSKILANAPSTIEGFGCRRGDLCRLRVVDEVRPNTLRQLKRSVKDWTVRCEALFGVCSRFVKERDATGWIESDCGAVRIKRLDCDCLRGDTLPTWASDGRRRSNDSGRVTTQRWRAVGEVFRSAN